MDDLETRIFEILNDPKKMEEVMGIAQSLGFAPPQDDAPAEAQELPGLPPMAELLREAGSGGGKQEALVKALKPFLKPDRQKKLERAVKVARLTHLAKFALGSDPDAI